MLHYPSGFLPLAVLVVDPAGRPGFLFDVLLDDLGDNSYL